MTPHCAIERGREPSTSSVRRPHQTTPGGRPHGQASLINENVQDRHGGETEEQRCRQRPQGRWLLRAGRAARGLSVLDANVSAPAGLLDGILLRLLHRVAIEAARRAAKERERDDDGDDRDDERDVCRVLCAEDAIDVQELGVVEPAAVVVVGGRRRRRRERWRRRRGGLRAALVEALPGHTGARVLVRANVLAVTADPAAVARAGDRKGA
ncbi:hypothetical protein EMIHUDRAFT_445124 [Emiliania huxleyi CCMP1516]|uniref:Uncharacterized protein n=2 Tax=Emiliania huxleyi TaxID=2903 RepID=A0A0D3J516_EMIH1|nr:hypothetical protein EMIHUDRAFT_445124 [Emiliania huxleyi CCMP1516]EOD18601.1 hypothetical protein EMIHUDRAFT_445124 [Emiliania huxleyi CCMP1516]|eukprot:XP_005771030.1 hypothetical protein EMIHUDRAFT_445124 [Emiliania huxleyi CCMP1516]